MQDHPRRCGENLPYTGTVLTGQGSPPQVRGKQGFGTDYALGDRITPAGAGKTTTADILATEYMDHPRRCGENPQLAPRAVHDAGSPPRMRGKLKKFKKPLLMRGITPAGAGKTSSSSETRAVITDHPRRCGENGAGVSCLGSLRGSPPQVRGKHLICQKYTHPKRITPAGAGKTA